MITVEHAMGKTEVPANPKRVVILTNEGTEALLELGVKPVGAVKSWIMIRGIHILRTK